MIKEALWRNRKTLNSLALKTIVVMMIVFLLSPEARASEPINIEKLADAIYLAEGGAKTKYPYGILTKYKHTTPRQACINTIKHALKDFPYQTKYIDFIEFLGSRYAPIGADNDPKGLNKNWVKNVNFYYKGGEE